MFKPRRIEDIGFGKVEMKISIGGQELPRGTPLSQQFLADMNPANRNALIESGKIIVFPPSVNFNAKDKRGVAAASETIGGEKIIVNRGFGKFDVIQGTYLAKNVTKDEADEAVAAKKDKAPKPDKKQKSKPAAPKPAKKSKTKKAKVPKPKPGEPDQNGPVA